MLCWQPEQVQVVCGCYCPQAPPIFAHIEVRLCPLVSALRTSAAWHLVMSFWYVSAALSLACVEFSHAFSRTLTEVCGQVSVKSFIGEEERESILILMGVHTLNPFLTMYF